MRATLVQVADQCRLDYRRGNCCVKFAAQRRRLPPGRAVMSRGSVMARALVGRLGLLMLAVTAVAGCRHAAAEAPNGGPPRVTVALPLNQEIVDYADYT